MTEQPTRAANWNPKAKPWDKIRIPPEIFNAASMAAFPGLPEGMPPEEAERRIAAALDAAWPVIARYHLAQQGDVLVAAMKAEGVPEPQASRIWNRFFFGEPEGLAG